jgi:hypothetical protein
MQLLKKDLIRIIGESSGEAETTEDAKDQTRTSLFHYEQRNATSFIALTRPTW